MSIVCIFLMLFGYFLFFLLNGAILKQFDVIILNRNDKIMAGNMMAASNQEK